MFLNWGKRKATTFSPDMSQIKNLNSISPNELKKINDTQLLIKWCQIHPFPSEFIKFKVTKSDSKNYEDVQRLAFVNQSKLLFGIVGKIQKKIQKYFIKTNYNILLVLIY